MCICVCVVIVRGPKSVYMVTLKVLVSLCGEKVNPHGINCEIIVDVDRF